MNYVMHFCRNSRKITVEKDGKEIRIQNPNYCNNGWIDEDVTSAYLLAPTWKYCKECCEKMGIDFDKQKPSDYRTEKQNEKCLNLHLYCQKSRGDNTKKG